MPQQHHPRSAPVPPAASPAIPCGPLAVPIRAPIVPELAALLTLLTPTAAWIPIAGASISRRASRAGRDFFGTLVQVCWLTAGRCGCGAGRGLTRRGGWVVERGCVSTAGLVDKDMALCLGSKPQRSSNVEVHHTLRRP